MTLDGLVLVCVLFRLDEDDEHIIAVPFHAQIERYTELDGELDDLVYALFARQLDVEKLYLGYEIFE